MSITIKKGGTVLYKKYASLRDAQGITDYKVAKDTGISTATLSNWKKGNYCPKINKLLILSNYFKVPLSNLISEKEKGEN